VSPARAGGAERRKAYMTLCPIAIAVGCKKCPAFSVCPLKTILRDQKKIDTPNAKQTDTAEPSPK
jgi:hypothetical protein